MFKLLKSTEIILEKWNQCVRESLFPHISGYSWYLDSICPSWYGIVNKEYNIIIPVCISTQFGRTKVFQPPFVPKIGIFYKKLLSIEEQTELAKFMGNKFSNINLVFNKFSTIKGLNYTKLKSFYVDLNTNYRTIYNNYSPKIQNYISEGIKQKYYFTIGILPNEVISFLNNLNYFDNEQLYNYLRRLLANILYKRKGTVYAMFGQDNFMLGLGVFLQSSNSFETLLLVTKDNNELFKAIILDRFIKNNHNKAYTLYLDTGDNELWKQFSAKAYYNYQLYKQKGFFHFFSKKNS